MSMSLAELGEISKAKAHQDDVPEGYRESHLAGINPRSRTYVKEGTAIQRVGIPLVGGIAGQAVGGIVGSKVGGQGGANLGRALGGAAGATPGLHRNIKSGETISYHKKTGAKAKSKVRAPFNAGTYNVY